MVGTQVDTHEDAESRFRNRITHLRSTLLDKPHDTALISEIVHAAEEYFLFITEGITDYPEVTAVMPAYISDVHKEERIDYLCHAVESVLEQDFHDKYELVIVDDGSEVEIGKELMRRYRQFVREVKDENGNVRYSSSHGVITLIEKRHNSGNDVEPRNLGLIEALRRGSSYIAHIDSDDAWPADKLRIQHGYLEKNRDADFLHGRHICIGKNGEVLEGTDMDRYYNFHRKESLGIDERLPDCKGVAFRNNGSQLRRLQEENWIHGGTPMYRTNVILRVGIENLKPERAYGADWDFWKRISKVANMDYINEVLTFCRMHDSRMSTGRR